MSVQALKCILEEKNLFGNVHMAAEEDQSCSSMEQTITEEQCATMMVANAIVKRLQLMEIVK